MHNRIVALVAIAAGGMLVAQQSPPGPAQPIAYSHAQHAGTLKLACATCHENKDPGETMGIPATGRCMTCHSSVKTDSPEIAKLTSFHEQKRAVPWVRVYQIPSYVFFSHRAHMEAGGSCQECHGNVSTSDVLKRESDISMGGCMDCHRRKKASNDCSYCHEQRN